MPEVFPSLIYMMLLMSILAFPHQEKMSVGVGHSSTNHEPEGIGQGQDDM
jgi:hypothetical protein